MGKEEGCTEGGSAFEGIFGPGSCHKKKNYREKNAAGRRERWLRSQQGREQEGRMGRGQGGRKAITFLKRAVQGRGGLQEAM